MNMHTASKNESLGFENFIGTNSHITITTRSARHMIGEARTSETGSEKREFAAGEDCVIELRAMARRDQSADCHVRCDGKPDVAGLGVRTSLASLEVDGAVYDGINKAAMIY